MLPKREDYHNDLAFQLLRGCVNAESQPPRLHQGKEAQIHQQD